ncbi:tetratricopeptide repeat protein [Spirochaeta cellobiosiphila]|uniref:tetratricopeptide repeat protein n=1 Tax=Spirochaeta cellobiosiphila TaxID=504483 RepID=UPI0003F94FA8|nr:hypothetical protein [Spirochaeta cellobiosiphila]
MYPRKLLLPLLLALLSLLILGCPQKAEADQTKEAPSPSAEDIVKTEEHTNPGDVVIEKAPVNTDTANSRDPYWSTLGYETWQGITDVTELPESVMLDMLNVRRMMFQSLSYPTKEEIITKYQLQLGKLTAENLNSVGYDLYTQGDYLSAMQLFVEAMRIDPTYVYAHYNFACAGSLYLQYWSKKDSGQYVTQEGYYDEDFLSLVQDEIFQNISISVFLASRYLEKSKTDSDLEYIRSLKRYSNLRQNSSTPEFWNLYGYHKSIVSNIDEFPESGELSVTLDGGFYSALTISDLINNSNSLNNQWEYDFHKFINFDKVHLIKVDYDERPQFGYRINYDKNNDHDAISRQPYIIAYNNYFKIEGLLLNDDNWKVENRETLYSYDAEYPQNIVDDTLKFQFCENWEISNNIEYFNSISTYYDMYHKMNSNLIDKKLRNKE